MPSKPASAEQINNAVRTYDADEDELFVKRAQNGDMDAFEELVKKYEGKVFGIASRMLAFGEDAKDAAQESFIKAYRSLKGFRGDSKFSTWLYRITNNVCLDYLRKRSRSELSLDFEAGGNGGGNGGGGELYKTVIPADIDVEATVEGNEFRHLVQKAINSLPAQHRAMIVMRDVQYLSYIEIAGLLGLPEGTVKSRLNRARRNLRTVFLGLRELKEYIDVK